MRPTDRPATTVASTLGLRGTSVIAATGKPSTPSEIASSALSTANQALRLCAEAVRVLEARVSFLEQALTMTHGMKQAAATTVQALTEESRSHVDTATAARLLSVDEKTLRRWARQGNGPLTPARDKQRLRWPVRDIRLLVTRD